MSELQFQFDTQGIDWLALEALFKAANLHGREGDKIRRAFQASGVVCFAKDKARLVGAARALTDHEYHGTIYDVVVDPGYQRRGIGTRLLSELLARLPVWPPLCQAPSSIRSYFGNDEYPRGFFGGKGFKWQSFFPHFEHLMRFATSSSRASQPHSLPKVCGSALRSCPHAAHLSSKVYWPNSSLNFSIRNSRRMRAILAIWLECVHPVVDGR
ncbi:MAG TPA: GNAT family N-acetyltransferase [Steroidobacteraceae bacterium]|nr:GNAT family N-acetyltransferase [Steroidobacteraceae bacterium]